MSVCTDALTNLTPKAKGALLSAVRRKLRENRLADYAPYPKQLEFHQAVARERLLIAGNQLGKTVGMGFETAMHLTGRYPDDWQPGKIFDKPIAAWAAGVTGEATRDTVQRVLMGRPNETGTGAIPKDAIKSKTAKRGVADAIDTIIVKHGGGADVQTGESTLTFKSYDQGREKFQGETLDLMWFDEEPPLDVYTEGLTRTNATDGIVAITFTPLQGMSDVVRRFLLEKMPGTAVTTMTIDDALHYTPEQRAAIIAGYPAHEREARAKGIPTLGSGVVFPIDPETIKYQAMQLPAIWARIVGMDFGWDHPTAAAWLAWDRDTDTVYVYDAYRAKQQPAAVHAAAIIARGSWIPVAWPPDGNQHEKGGGEQLAQQYRQLNLAMLNEHARYPETNTETESPSSRVSVEAGVADMLTRFQTGRLKVAAHLQDVFEELALYHREDGRIVKINDDIISAIRYGIMMLRHAITGKPTGPRRIPYSPTGSDFGY